MTLWVSVCVCVCVCVCLSLPFNAYHYCFIEHIVGNKGGKMEGRMWMLSMTLFKLQWE